MKITSEQTNSNQTGRRFSAGSVLLITLMVGLASGLVAYEVGTMGLANGLGLDTSTLQTSNSSSDPATGFRWHKGFLGGQDTMVFGASSQVSNVSVTGFNISGDNQLTINLLYTGTGTSPSITIVAFSRGLSNGVVQTLSGSNVKPSGWTSPATVTINLAGTGSLTSAHRIAVLIVPYTGA